MTKQSGKRGSGTGDKEPRCCQVKAIVTVDERGQMVLPKDIREAAKINAGDKLAVIVMSKDEDICCLSLMKVEELSDAVKTKLGPVLKDMA
jgi:antitoxin PrlF